MEVIEKRKLHVTTEPEVNKYDDFRPTLIGCIPVFDTILLRELRLPDKGMIVKADAFREPCLFAEVIAVGSGQYAQAFCIGDVVRILKDVGTTLEFSDSEEGERYLTVNAQDGIVRWAV